MANACGAIVVSRHGCAPAMPTRSELDDFLVRKDLPFRIREDDRLEHLHWATTRHEEFEELTVLAIDHRSQFDDLVQELGCSETAISDFKRLALEALDKVADNDPRFGMLVDDRFGFDVLAELSNRPYWIGRPIEVARSRPLEFAGAGDVGMEISGWPLRHVVKCLAFYHADDPAELRERQERQLLRLFSACRETRHELLLEILPPPDIQVGQVLGLSAPIPDLIASFEAAASFPLIKGFAVGRSIFHDVAREWLSGGATDGDAIDAMAGRLSALVQGWRSARAAVGAAA